MQSDLRSLASQQEIYRADYGLYSTDAAALGVLPSSGVLVTIVASAES